MVIILYRPSPQVPQPSAQAAKRCFGSSAHLINLSNQQMIKAAVDISWVFLLTLFTSVNALLWSVSYREVRAAHSKDEVEELLNTALEIMDQCVERWPGTASAAQLYPIFAKACLHSYDLMEDTRMGLSLSDRDSSAHSDAGPQVKIEGNSPPQGQQQQPPLFNPPQFGYVFDATPESMNTNVQFDDPFHPGGPQFRSNSIFLNPTTSDSNRRRFSFFPPDVMMDDGPGPSSTGPQSTRQNAAAPSPLPDGFPSPPESISQSNMSTPTLASMNQASPPDTVQTTPTPTMTSTNLASVKSTPSQPASHQTPEAPPRSQVAITGRTPPFAISPSSQHHAAQQRPLPPATTVTDWFSPPPPFISPYAFPNMSCNFVGSQFPQGGAVGVSGPPGSQHAFACEGEGSLSTEQQMELMDLLENEGLGDIDTFLNTGMGLAGGGIDGGLSMQGWGYMGNVPR